MYKQVIIIRTDTDMRKGKMCGQVAHASVTAFYRSYAGLGTKYQQQMAVAWLADIQTKAVLKVGSEAELEALARKAEEAGIVTVRIHDAGHTQLDPNTFTCVGLGPDEIERLDAITGDLKLL